MITFHVPYALPYPHTYGSFHIYTPPVRAVDYFEHFSCYVKSQFPSELKNVIEISVDSFDCKFNECSLWLSHSAQKGLKIIHLHAFEMRVKFDLYISTDRNGINNGFEV